MLSNPRSRGIVSNCQTGGGGTIDIEGFVKPSPVWVCGKLSNPGGAFHNSGGEA